MEIFTDGAYSSVRNQGGIGIVFVKDGTKIYEFNKPIVNTTNNKCELLSVIIALNAISKPIDSIVIYSDSQYVIGCATKGWQRKKNQLLWKLFDEEFKRVSALCPHIEFKHVKGHADDKWNNYVDKLAVDASKELL